MKCPHCGAENPDNGIFCTECNGWILSSIYQLPPMPVKKAPAPTPPPAPKKPKWKVIVPTVAALCTVIFLIALFLPGGEDPAPTTSGPLLNTAPSTTLPSTTLPSTTVQPTTLPPEELPAIETGMGHIEPFNNDGKLGFYCDGVYTLTDLNYAFYVPANFSLSLDGRTSAYLSKDGQLLYLRSNEMRIAAEDVLCYELSATGDGLAYMDTDRELYLYDCGSGLSVCVTTDIPYNISKDFAISPDGKTVAFLVPSSAGGTSAPLSLRWYQDGQITDPQAYYANEAHIIAVSNGGTCAFMQRGFLLSVATTATGNVDLGGSNVLLMDNTASVLLNADHSQMLYWSSYHTYLADDSTQITTVSEDELYVLRSRVLHPLIDYSRIWTGCEDLTELLLYYEQSQMRQLCTWLPDATVEPMESTWKSVSITADERFIFMTDMESILWRMDTETYETIPVATNVSKCMPNFDGSKVYFICENQLYCVNGDGSGRTVWIAEVPKNVELYMTRDSRLYYLDGEQLYVCNPDGAFGAALSGVESCKVGKDGRLYAYTDSNQTYISSGFSSFHALHFTDAFVVDPSDGTWTA